MSANRKAAPADVHIARGELLQNILDAVNSAQPRNVKH